MKRHLQRRISVNTLLVNNLSNISIAVKTVFVVKYNTCVTDDMGYN